MFYRALLVFLVIFSGSTLSARSQQPLSIYCPMPEPDCAHFLTAFQQDTGIDARFIRIPAGEVLARLRAEKANPQADLWFGGPVDIFIQAANEGLLAPYQPEGLARIDPRFVNTGNHLWAAFSWGVMSFAYNEGILKELGTTPPDSWESFADPVFRDNIVMAHPAASGTAYFVLAAMVQIYGEEEALRIMKEIDKNVLHYSRTGAAGSRMVANGEIALTIVHLTDLQNLWKEGYSSGVSFPKEGTGFSVDGFALIKGAPENRQKNAKALIDWLLSERGQAVVAETLRQPVIQNYNNPHSTVDLTDLKLINYDYAWAGENRARLLERYEREVRRGSEAK